MELTDYLNEWNILNGLRYSSSTSFDRKFEGMPYDIIRMTKLFKWPDVFSEWVTKSFKRPDAFNEQMTKSFEQFDVFNEWVTKQFERVDVSSKWVTKPFEPLTSSL